MDSQLNSGPRQKLKVKARIGKDKQNIPPNVMANAKRSREDIEVDLLTLKKFKEIKDSS